MLHLTKIKGLWNILMLTIHPLNKVRLEKSKIKSQMILSLTKTFNLYSKVGLVIIKYLKLTLFKTIDRLNTY